jgi:hypothetical protein
VVQLASQTGQIIPGTFTPGSALSAVVWEGQNQPVLLTPSVSWLATNPTTGESQTGYDQWQVLCSTVVTQSSGLNPGGDYRLQITSTAFAITTVVADVQLQVIGTPGSTAPMPPDLATYDFILAYCSSIGLTANQVQNIPALATAASIAIRRKTNRNFDLRTYVKKFDVTIYGIARLDQVPIQLVNRVQGPRQLALTISNNSQSVSYAQAYFAYTGQVDGYGNTIQTATGITLNWASNGTVTNQTVSYAAGQTIGQLAAAINSAYGPYGWSAVADSTPAGYGTWPVAELDGGYVGQGAALSAVPGDGAQFYVLSDISNAYLDDPWRGFLNVGRQQGNYNAGRWGPGGDSLWNSPLNQESNQVKVTFTAGESTIPQEIQTQCAELVKWKLSLSKTDQLLESENAADYSYNLAMDMVHNMPRNVAEALAPFTIFYA